MKAKKIYPYFFVLALGVVMASCTLQTALAPAESASSSLPQAWFDAPLPGTVFASDDEILVIVHGASKEGISELELSLVGGGMIGNQKGGGADTLLTASFTWHPPEPGNYTLQVRALNASGAWSDYAFTDVVISSENKETKIQEATQMPASVDQQTVEPTPTSAPETCTNLAAFVSETIPDDSIFKPGTAFTKTWTLKNAGTCTWTRQYSLAFYDGEQMNGVGIVLLSKEVLPGDQITVGVDMASPSQNGTYKGRWMMMDMDGNMFGLGDQGTVAFWVQIKVQTGDAQAPSVNVVYSPAGRGEPTGRQKITFTATASDNVNVTMVEIQMAVEGGDWQILITCENQTSCSVEVGPLTVGNYKVRALAFDATGNKGNSGATDFTVFP